MERSIGSASRRSKNKKLTDKSRPKKDVDLDDAAAIRRALVKDDEAAVELVKSMDLVVDSADGSGDHFITDICTKRMEQLKRKSAGKESTSSGGIRGITTTLNIAALGRKRKSVKNGPKGGLNPSSVYVGVNTLFSEHSKYSPNPGRVHGIKDLFSVQGMDENEAGIIIVSGGPGSGKSLLIKYILEQTAGDKYLIPGLEDFDLVFISDLKQDRYTNFSDLVCGLLKGKNPIFSQVGELTDCVLRMKILIILEDFDESIGDAIDLVREVLTMEEDNVTVLATCRPQYVDTLYNIIPDSLRQQTVHLEMNPLLMTDLSDFVNRLVEHRFNYSNHEMLKELILKGLIQRLPQIHATLGDELFNPLMLTIIAGMWFEHPLVEISHKMKKAIF